MIWQDLTIRGIWAAFIESVTQACESALERRRPSPRILLTEAPPHQDSVDEEVEGVRSLAVSLDSDGSLPHNVVSGLAASARGARLELRLAASRFFLRRVSLPHQAGAFVGDILRTQIDRLAPWPPQRVAFGHVLLPSEGETLVVGVAATDRALLDRLLEVLATLGPRSVRIWSASPPGSDLPDIPVIEREWGRLRHQVLSRGLSLTLAAAWALALLSSGVAAWETSSLGASYAEVQAQIAQRRTNAAPTDSLAAIEQRLIARKIATAPVTLLLEDVSRLLPDDAFLQEFEVSGDMIRLTGISRDASSLVRKIETSQMLSDASFFAPTTRGDAGGGEQFHVAARLRQAAMSKP
jgi:general secretion pathway protein L